MIAAISRGISVVGISLKNIIYFLLFIAVILFLFFIPEILKYDWSGLTSYTGFNYKPAVKEEIIRIQSPLDEVIERLNNGYYSMPKTVVSEQVKPAEPVLPPFNPRVRIKKLEILKVDPPLRYRSRRAPTTNLKLIGTLEGMDIRRAELLKNGNYVRSLQIDRPGRDGRREFVIQRSDAYGNWTIYLEDKQKRVYQKTYRFFPKIEAYRRSNDEFMLRHNVNGLDPKLEKAFTVRESGSGIRNTKAFVEF